MRAQVKFEKLNISTSLRILLNSVRVHIGNIKSPIIDHHPVGELEVLGAAKLVQHVAVLVEDDHPHHLDKTEVMLKVPASFENYFNAFQV